MKKEVYKKMLFSVIAKNLNWEILTRIQLLLKDEVKEEKLYYYVGSLENPFFRKNGEGGHKKTIYRVELPKKGGLASLQI